MTRETEPPEEVDASDDTGTRTRRAVLKLGAGATGAAIGIGGLTGSAAAWKRLDVDFQSEREVWLVVGSDVDYDPPAVVRVLVDTGDGVDCRTRELTSERTVSLPEEIGGGNVVPYEAGPGETILGVLPYNRSRLGDERFDRPRCVMRNDEIDQSSLAAEPADADCVQAATADHWNGEVRECWWDPIDVRDGDVRQRAKLVAADRDADYDFGESVAVNADGSVILVGAPGTAYPHGEDGGAAYVFTRQDGEYEQAAKLAADDGQSHDRFGESVALNAAGDTALVGQWRGRGGTDGVYVFRYEGAEWVQTAKLSPPDLGDRAHVSAFGDAVSLDAAGDTAIIGAPWTDDMAYSAGAVFVAERTGDGWTEPTPLFHDYGDDNYFGTSVDLSASGDVGAVGAPAPNRDTGPIHGGYAQIVRRTDGSWTRTSVHNADDPSEADGLGSAIACDADCETVVAGRPGDDVDDQTDVGGALAFQRTPTGWTGPTVLPYDGNAEDEFGDAVAVNATGQVALVGAPNRDTGAGTDAGAAYVYVRIDSEWRQHGRAVPTNGGSGAAFGGSVDLDARGRTAVIGAQDAGETDPGAAYVFHRS